VAKVTIFPSRWALDRDAGARHVQGRTVVRDQGAEDGEGRVAVVAGRTGGSGTVIAVGVRFRIESDLVCPADDDCDPLADISFASTKRLCQHYSARKTKWKIEMSKKFDGATVSSLIYGEV
jgi:hypothetical protein